MRAIVQAEIFILNLRNGCEETFWGMLQECTVEAFENSASYCVFLTCLAASPVFIYVTVLGGFFKDLHQKK